MDAQGAFADLLERDEDEVDLTRGALLFAAVEYPGLDVDACVARFDDLASRARNQISPNDSNEQMVAKLDAFLYGQEGFRGNEHDYYDPRNSYLNDVLERRLGMPISLAAVYLHVGRRVGMPLEGVGMPGHFLLRVPDQYAPLLIDPFNHGQIVTEEACKSRLRGLYGDRVPFVRDMLQAVGTRAILYRMLGNLKAVYVHQSDHVRAARTIDLMLLVDPSALGEFRDRGLIMLRIGDLRQARADFEHYLQLRPDADDAETIRGQLSLVDRLYTLRN